ncbi:TolC family protein [Cloacibacterium normanense]|uniref:Efflux transporter, outer membrane factor (OMF) lipo, NodT family protein n=1 Tax=Cloacibacterium normanense TaxID=237258 RepID=A0A1E5UI35_9FLAO|nr:efflux transporter outer membrane subunit [Cloacibacterium normanense]AZI68988.1 efflux transporter outer membrane subunit [Cloacibacterium normanense]OEL12478.1 efflux transporter, outer membrane factor (OMF) lipo, NodT family protein [Cloacibacterium normanense]SDO59749.1 efflux transporter, outer membrane factor (OMF) lipoprotein, NodT family [Cloacibacterium normanense]
MKITIHKIILIFFVSFLVVSCHTRQNYQRANDVVDEKLFRTDALPKDSLSMANLSWKEIFTDAVLQNHIAKALENNLDIRIALQNIASAEAYLKQSKAAYQPTISVGPDYSFNTSSLNTQFGQIVGERRYINQFDITANLGWELDLWGKLKGQEKAQYAAYLSSVAAHQNVKSNLVASIATAYYQLLAFDEQKKIFSNTIEIRKKNLETTKALKEAGIVSEVAVQQSEALVYNAEASLVTLDVQIQMLENTISLLMGEPSHEIERTSLSTQNFALNTDVGYPSALLANRPDVKQAEFNLINAFELTNAAKAQFYPSLRITGSTGVQSVDIDKLFSANSVFANVLVGLAQPILNKRQIRTNYEVSLANQERAYLNFRKTILNAGNEVSDALKMYNAQDQFIAFKKKELSAYDKSVEFSQELVNYGMANYLEVLNANVNKLNAEINIANAQYTKLQAGVELYRALGGGWR